MQDKKRQPFRASAEAFQKWTPSIPSYCRGELESLEKGERDWKILDEKKSLIKSKFSWL